MGIFKTALFWVALSLVSFFPAATAYTSYPNAFVDPNFILAGKYDAQTQAAQQSIIAWADELNAQSPWCKFFFFFSFDYYELKTRVSSRHKKPGCTTLWRLA